MFWENVFWTESYLKQQPSESDLVKPGDLLVTTGMDGVFPAGLWVAKVVQVEELREGACTYTLEAKATAGDLDQLSYVSVFPPLEQTDWLGLEVLFQFFLFQKREYKDDGVLF